MVYGVLLAGFGAGAFVAGVSNGHLRRIASQELLIALACIGCATCCLLLALTSSMLSRRSRSRSVAQAGL
ncbi:MAG: hypothetical protein EOQ39_30200 [Mesorhizobium sp.]|nr:MAG: hypothetical protein EOQ37_35400 [Mesorhizobium sp.]RWB10872.1 MAG: hypothetical protein EOQ39_30200 [Mesorhizobium sp.]